MNLANSTVAITGASGFIGKALSLHLAKSGHQVMAISRSPFEAEYEGIVPKTITQYSDVEALCAAFGPATVVIHLADRPARTQSPDQEARPSMALATHVVQAMQASGICRLIAVSSIYARTATGEANAYGESKRAMEEVFRSAAGVESIILRLPPVYGPNGKGGFALLASLVLGGLPLPLGCATAPRDYLFIDNLCDLLGTIVAAKDDAWASAVGHVFEPSDGCAISTRELIQELALAAGRPARLINIPASLVRLIAAALGKRELAAPFEALEVLAKPSLQDRFGWSPPVTLPGTLASVTSALEVYKSDPDHPEKERAQTASTVEG